MFSKPDNNTTPSRRHPAGIMAILSFTLSEEGVSTFRDALICLNKFSDDVSLEARKDSVRNLVSFHGTGMIGKLKRTYYLVYTHYFEQLEISVCELQIRHQ